MSDAAADGKTIVDQMAHSLALLGGSDRQPDALHGARLTATEMGFVVAYVRALERNTPVPNLLQEVLAFLKKSGPGPACSCCSELRALILKLEAALAMPATEPTPAEEATA